MAVTGAGRVLGEEGGSAGRWNEAEIADSHGGRRGGSETEGLTADDLALRCGLHPATLEAYIRFGVVSSTPRPVAFPSPPVVRLRKAIRLRRDLGVNLVAVGILLDLLDRQEAMALELTRLRAELSRALEDPTLE